MSDRRRSKLRLTVSLLCAIGMLLAMGCEKKFAKLCEEKPAKLPTGFEEAFIIPDSDKDQWGNPVHVRNGRKAEPDTGYPYEVWLKQPRMEFVLVPAGEFMMGSSISGVDAARRWGVSVRAFKEERPQHKVRITKPFYLAKYETTNGQYRLFKSGHDSKDHTGHSLNGDTQPVVYVSWHDATAFCEWLTGQAHVQVALPSEAQWEYACRAGTTGIWYWGASEPAAAQYANVRHWTAKPEFAGRPISDTDDGHLVGAPVGKFMPNAFGLHDMIGNVWEWCEDGRRRYGSSAEVDPRGPDTDGRVLRGGSWLCLPRYARSANRLAVACSDALFYYGFRVCVVVSSQ